MVIKRDIDREKVYMLIQSIRDKNHDLDQLVLKLKKELVETNPVKFIGGEIADL